MISRIDSAVVWTAVRSVSFVAVIVLVYALTPIGRFDIVPLLTFIAGMAVFVTLLVFQLRSIARATRPGLRAIESAVVLLAVVVIVFATLDAVVSAQDPSAFTEPLSKIDAIYFSLTLVSTVGFGDLTPVTDQARLLVAIQLAVNIVLLATIFRLLIAAVQRARREPVAVPDE